LRSVKRVALFGAARIYAILDVVARVTITPAGTGKQFKNIYGLGAGGTQAIDWRRQLQHLSSAA
jgi:hypothetical protein